MKAFWALVRNDSKLEQGDRRQRSLLNSIYFAIALTLGSQGLTWAAHQGFISGGFFIWCFLISIPYADSIYLNSKEWQEGTTGWWLTLPYSRSILLSAKIVASFWRVLKMYAIFFVSTLVMTLFYNFILPDFLFHPQLLDLFQGYANVLAWLLVMSPFSILLGSLIVIIAKSYWAPAHSLSWIGLGLLANLYVAMAFGLAPINTSSALLKQGYFLSVNGTNYFTTLLISLAASTLLFAFSVYLLKRHVEV